MRRDICWIACASRKYANAGASSGLVCSTGKLAHSLPLFASIWNVSLHCNVADEPLSLVRAFAEPDPWLAREVCGPHAWSWPQAIELFVPWLEASSSRPCIPGLFLGGGGQASGKHGTEHGEHGEQDEQEAYANCARVRCQPCGRSEAQ